ncbi:MAG: DUF87 domain-containing protein [Thermosipho sp. (in: Bacteria)]|nr:DUF87 domain-containing protein [Thermosipho sp. (in: thermotogales)]
MIFKRKRKEKQTPAKQETNKKLEFKDREPSIFERHKKNLKDLIAPEDIDFAQSPKYATMGDKYLMKNMYIGLLPNEVNFATFLHDLYNYGNIDTSVFINPIDSETAKAELSKLRTNLEMEYLDSEGSTNRADDMAAKVAEARRLRNEVRDGINKIFEVCIFSTLFETSLRELNNRADSLKAILGQSDIGLKCATLTQEEVFKTNKPFNKIYLDLTSPETHIFDKRSAAAVFPFTQNNINHPGGVLFGFNMDNGLPIFYNNFDDSLASYNIVCFARTGSGKSTTLKMLAARSSTLDSIQNIAIDIEPEYIELAETLGGINIYIEPESDTIINPFDITLDIVTSKKTGKQHDKILIQEKINSVTSILMSMAQGNTGQNPYFDDILRMIIKDCVKKEYQRLGITEDPDSLYTYEEQKIVDGKLVGGKVKKEMPTLSTWYQQLEKEAEKNQNETYQPYYDYLIKVMADYTKYKDGSFTCFDGQSTVELNYDIPFINFVVSSLNEKNELPIAQHIIGDYIWEKLVKRNVGTGHKIRVIIDEAWRMVKYPEALDFLVTGFRRARKKNTSFCIISQQFDEFYGEETKSIIKNAETKLFLKPDESSVKHIKEVFDLTEGETHFLRNCKIGECLMKVGNTSVKARIEIPDFEIGFIETNQNKLANSRETA